MRKANTKLWQLKADAVTFKDFTSHFDNSKNTSFILNHKEITQSYMGSFPWLLFPHLMLLCNILGPVNLSQKCTNTHSYIQNIYIHVIWFLTIRILFNVLFISKNWFPAFINNSTATYFLWLYLPVLLMISNHYTTLQSFLTTTSFPILSSLSFVLPLSCVRNQAMMSCSGISPHFHNLDKSFHWFKEEL